MVKKAALVACVALVSVTVSIQGQAREKQPRSKKGLALEEIVVTARKRAESVQDVPLSIVPFQTEQLMRRDIQNMSDLANNTIGLTYSVGVSSGVQGTATIRGLSTSFVQDRFQNVGIYLDGVYLQRQSMMNIGMIDLARVEVVKGPQNALYGRNAFAGAINYVTERPTPELSGYLMTTQGSDDREDYRAEISGPIISDKLFGRIAGGTSEYDGNGDNPHPFADANVPGDNNDGNLGGWDDETWSAALIYNPTDRLELGLTYYDTELKREFQPGYYVNGLQEVARFGTSSYDDMNYNQKTIDSVDPIAAPVTGYTMWRGELPYLPGPGTYINTSSWGTPGPDPKIPGAVDPRGFGSSAKTEMWSFNVDWDINNEWSLNYLFGYIDHDSETKGPAARDALQGSTYSDVYPFGDVIYSSDFSSRPNSNMDTQSHELRFDWNGGGDWFVSVGFFYSQTDDEQYDLTLFAPPCSDRDLNGDGSNADEIAGCNLEITTNTPSQLSQAQQSGLLIFFDTYWAGQKSNWSRFDDDVYAMFSEVSWNVTPDLVARAELRFTQEDRKIQRLADGFGLAYQQIGVGDGLFPPLDTEMMSSILVPEDDEKFDYFAPRLSVDWSWSDNSMVYGYLAKGVKSGGFNNTEDQSQLTYDEEENWTLELGSKNVLFDGRLTLNGAIFYIDWTDIQGAESPKVENQNANVSIGNIGDATNYGFEIDGTWRFNEVWSVDLAYTWINPEYEDDTEYDAAQRYYYYECELDYIPNGTLCGNTDVGGNQVQRTSKEQAIAALNYRDDWFDGWTVSARVDASYQSKQYLDALNEGYIGSRTLYNGSVNVTSPLGHWDFTLWGKNLDDEEYISSSFTNSLFNKFLVGQGPGRSYGMTAKYNFF